MKNNVKGLQCDRTKSIEDIFNTLRNFGLSNFTDVIVVSRLKNGQIVISNTGMNDLERAGFLCLAQKAIFDR